MADWSIGDNSTVAGLDSLLLRMRWLSFPVAVAGQSQNKEDLRSSEANSQLSNRFGERISVG